MMLSVHYKGISPKQEIRKGFLKDMLWSQGPEDEQELAWAEGRTAIVTGS